MKKIASQVKIREFIWQPCWSPLRHLIAKEHTQSFMVVFIYSLKEYLALSLDVPSFGNKYTKVDVLN